MITITKQMENQVLAKVEECYQNAEKIFNRKFIRPNVLFNIRGVRLAGQADSLGTIRFNKRYINECLDDILANTVPHEVAHLIEFYVYGRMSHSETWRRFCQLLGGTGKKNHSMKLEIHEITNGRHKKEFSAKCDCKIHKITQNRATRMKKGAGYRCTLCGSKLQLLN